MTPTQVLGPDGTQRESKALYVDQITLTAERVTVRLRSPDGTIGGFVQVGQEAGVFDEDAKELGAMGEVVSSFLRSESVGRQLGVETHNREDREGLKWFTFGVAGLGDRKFYLQNSAVEPPGLHQITAIEIVGKFSWQQTELRFAVVDIDGRAHGIAQAPWLGKDAVWVATPGDDDGAMQLGRPVGDAVRGWLRRRGRAAGEPRRHHVVGCSGG